MLDIWLSRMLSWGLFISSLAFFGAISAFYFLFCWLVTGLIDGKLLRKEREETLARDGVPAEEIDSRLLPRDRAIAIARGAFAFGVAAAFHFFA